MQSITHLAHNSKNQSQVFTGTLPVRAFHPDRFFGTLHIDGQRPRVAALVCHQLDIVAISLVGYDTSIGAALANLWNRVAVPFLFPQDLDWRGPRKLERRAEGYKQFTTRLEGTKEVHAIALCIASQKSSSVGPPSSFSPWLPVTLPRGYERADDRWPNQYEKAILPTKGRGA